MPASFVVHVSLAQAEPLRQLSALLARSFPACEVTAAPTPPAAAALLICAPGLCSPEACRERVAQGTDILILTPFPRRDEHEQYLRAGALAYLGMDLDLRALVAAVEASIAHRQGNLRPRRNDEPTAGSAPGA